MNICHAGMPTYLQTSAINETRGGGGLNGSRSGVLVLDKLQCIHCVHKEYYNLLIKLSEPMFVPMMMMWVCVCVSATLHLFISGTCYAVQINASSL